MRTRTDPGWRSERVQGPPSAAKMPGRAATALPRVVASVVAAGIERGPGSVFSAAVQPLTNGLIICPCRQDVHHRVIVLILYSLKCCDCQRHGISIREAKSFFETQPNTYIMNNDFMSVYLKKDRFKDSAEWKTRREGQKDVDSNQIPWMAGAANKDTPLMATKEGPTTDKNFRIAEFGETEKIVTVRVSSSVARSTYYGGKSNYEEKPKLTALQRSNYNVNVPNTMANYASGILRYPVLQSDMGLQSKNDDENEARYYETRIEAVSSREEVVFGKAKAVASTTPPAPEYEYYREPEATFFEVPEMNYELQEKNYELEEKSYELPDKNFEADESVGLMADDAADEKMLPEERSKLGYVMDGRHFKKYRVEERTADGFIVGEYGFVRHEDGTLHGVRYTADVTANPRLIYDALVKFLSL